MARDIDWRALCAEFVGTFIRTAVAAGCGVVSAAGAWHIPWEGRIAATGLSDLAMILTLGAVSGNHINPVVSFAFACRGVFPWKSVPRYWAAQMAGAVMAAGMLISMFGYPASLSGLTQPHFGDLTGCFTEIFITFVLVLVVLSTANRHKLVANNVAIAVASTIVFNSLFAWPITGASMNPARSLGPALASGNLASIWVYVLGPFVGALLAVGATWVLHGPANLEEEKAAQGEDRDGDPRKTDQPQPENRKDAAQAASH